MPSYPATALALPPQGAAPADEPDWFWDRSRRELDQKCPRARYYSTEYAGRGLQPALIAEPLDVGIVLHDILARYLGGEPLIGALEEAFQEGRRIGVVHAPEGHPDLPVLADEWGYILRGWVLGFAHLILPGLLKEYDIVSIEVSQVWNHAHRMQYAFKPDLILRRRSDETLWYLEFKSTGKVDSQWFRSWEKAVQLHLAAYAWEQTHTQPLSGVIVQGFHKGRRDPDAHRSSPLIGGWVLPGDPPLLPAQFAAKRPQSWKGWKQIKVWDFPGGQDAWFLTLEGSLISEFPQSLPIFLNREMAEAALRQVTYRESEIQQARWLLGEPNVRRESVMDKYFPQTFSQCEPAWGDPCPFNACCWEPAAGAEPLQHGYQWRQPHHAGDPANRLRLVGRREEGQDAD